MFVRPSRRDVLKVGAAATAGLATGALPDALLRAMAGAPTAGKLSDIEQVILIRENRSFDHYFGAYHGARDLNEYSSGSPVWGQAYSAQGFTDAGATIQPPNPMRPFHLSVSAGGCVQPRQKPPVADPASQLERRPHGSLPGQAHRL